MSSLTRSQIINTAIKQAGAEGLSVQLAEIWLDNILDRLYEDHKWPFQEKPAEGVVGVTNQLPSDYLDLWNRYGLRLVDSDGKTLNLKIRDNDFLDLITDPNIKGTPEVAVIDLNARTWRTYPLPDKAYTWKLRYKYKPQRLADVVAANPNTDPKPVFPNDQLLIEAVFTAVLQYEDDDRVVQDLAFVDALVRRYKHGINKSPAKTDTMQLNPEVFKKISSMR